MGGFFHRVFPCLLRKENREIVEGSGDFFFNEVYLIFGMRPHQFAGFGQEMMATNLSSIHGGIVCVWWSEAEDGLWLPFTWRWKGLIFIFILVEGKVSFQA